MFGQLENDTRLEKFIRSLRAIYWLTLVIVIGPTAYLLACIPIMPLHFIAPQLFKTIENFLCSMNNKCLGVLACWSGFNIVEYGADVDELSAEKCLVMMNHQTHADHFPLLAAFSRKSSGHGGPVWMIYKFPALRWCPLGIAWALHGNFFVQVGRTQIEMERLQRHLDDVYYKRNMDWLVLYPEGATLPKYKVKSQEFAKLNGFPHLNHSALPRTASVKKILDANKLDKAEYKNAPIKYIIDVTMAWKGGNAPLIGEMFGGYRNPQKTYMLYRVFKMSEMPSESEESVRKWLYDRWVEKDQILDDFYKTGKFAAAYDQKRSRKVEYSFFEGFFVQTFWIGLFTVQMIGIAKLIGCMF